jgi:hypothetical protein
MPGSMDGLELMRLTKKRWPSVVRLVTSGQSTITPADLPCGVLFLTSPIRSSRSKPHCANSSVEPSVSSARRPRPPSSCSPTTRVRRRGSRHAFRRSSAGYPATDHAFAHGTSRPSAIRRTTRSAHGGARVGRPRPLRPRRPFRPARAAMACNSLSRLSLIWRWAEKRVQRATWRMGPRLHSCTQLEEQGKPEFFQPS